MRIACHINNLSLRGKLIFIYTSIWILFFAISFFYAYYNQGVVEKQILETLHSRSLNYTQMLNSQFMVYESLANLVSNNSRLNEELESPYHSVLDALDVYQDIWDQYEANRLTWPHLRHITVYSSNDTLHNSYPYLVRLDEYMEGQPEYETILELGTVGYWSGFRNIRSREYWEPSNRDRSDGAYQSFAYSRVLYSAKHLGVPIGMLTIEVDGHAITDLIETQDHFQIALLDQNGNAITATETETHIDLSRIPAEKGKVRIENEWYYVEESVLNNGWKIMTVVPLAEAGSISNMIWTFGGLLFLLVNLIIIPLILLFSRQVSRRFDSLIRKMEAFMKGDMQLGAPISGKDEAGILDAHFTKLAAELKKQIHETYAMQLQKEKLRLEILQTQINPHFLYNTLSTIAWLSDNHPRSEIREAVEDLERFYRQTLSKGKDLVSLESELQAVRAYVNLQKKRYVNRISVYYQIDPLTLGAQIPKVTIQPLVENSIRHGLTGDRSSISILIASGIADDVIWITVQDDGAGMDPDTLKQLVEGTVVSKEGNSLGFRNVDDRIKLYYGNRYGLQARSQLGAGTTVTISLPCESAELSPSEAELLEIKVEEKQDETK